MSDEIEKGSCVSCSNEHPLDDLNHTSVGDLVCGDCVGVCAYCDSIGTDRDDWYTVDGNNWCESCWENESFYCDHCEENLNSHRTGYSLIDGNERWCEYCTQDHANYCENCDEYYSSNACRECGGDADLIQEYRYKPDPVFHGIDKHNLFMGFELEMELNQCPNYGEAVESTRPLVDSQTAYLKRDGSINGVGFELVTHPHTLGAYEQATEMWDIIERLRTDYRARSWDTDSCGLHVHVSRNAFKSGAHIHRFLKLIYGNPVEMSKLGGRKGNRFAGFDDVYIKDEYGIPRFNLTNKVSKPYKTERYGAVNVLNEHTLELRFFRGNMKREGVMSALELTHAAVEYARDLSISDVKLGMLSWDWFADWVASNNGLYPNLYLRMSKVPSVNLNTRPLLNA